MKTFKVQVKCQDSHCEKMGELILNSKKIELTADWQVIHQGSDPVVFFCPEHRRALLVPGLIRR